MQANGSTAYGWYPGAIAPGAHVGAAPQRVRALGDQRDGAGPSVRAAAPHACAMRLVLGARGVPPLFFFFGGGTTVKGTKPPSPNFDAYPYGSVLQICASASFGFEPSPQRYSQRKTNPKIVGSTDIAFVRQRFSCLQGDPL